MKKPELVVREYKGRFIATCTSCPESVFRSDIATDDRDYFERAFKLHFKTVHMREDASQVAARIVREATED